MSTAARTSDAAARDAALAAAAGIEAEPTSLVDYDSRGRLLIVGPAEQALAAARRLPPELDVTVLAGSAAGTDAAQVRVLHRKGRRLRLQGHLGRYQAVLEDAQGATDDLAALLYPDQPHFDLVLDLDEPPALGMEIPPPGYYAPRGEAAALAAALEALPGMVGEFEKPRFFDYNPDICAHGQKGLEGCRRCIDACPTEAIISLVDRVGIDPHLCQGGGSCATTCPTGAIVYRYPRSADTQNRLRAMLRTYRERGGMTPVILVRADAGRGEPPANVLTVQVEEIGSVGMEVWLAALAYGASAVLIALARADSGRVATTLREQLGHARTLLAGMGYPGEALGTVEPDAADPLGDAALMPAIRPAGLPGSDDKRYVLTWALDHLHDQATAPHREVALAPGAPFGQVKVDREACTLCMACVSVCPPFALSAGGEEPRLTFSEAACVQCGLCQLACPEDAVSLEARFIYPPEERKATRVLHEEPPFCCLGCGKPFATRSVIEKITTKLRSHHMFQNEAALRRIQMCEDCRVRDMFSEDLHA